MLRIKSRISKLLVSLFVLTSLVAMPIPSANAVPACDTTNFSVAMKSNSVFYYDDGTAIKSGYVQFAITNKTGSSAAGYYASLTRTAGTALNLAAKESVNHPLVTQSPYSTTVANNATVNVYWYLTASAVSASTQSFQLGIYNSSNTLICNVTKSFTSTASTIAASANKVTSVTFSSIGAAAADGSSTFTITVNGATGTIGQGPSNQYDVNLNPTTNEKFAAQNYRLAGTTYTCGGTTVTNQLFIANACAGNYTAVFTYQYLDSVLVGDATSSLTPIMQIASGTQMKHTTPPTFTIQSINSVATSGPAPQVTTQSATGISDVQATLNGTIDAGTMTAVKFCYSTTNLGTGNFGGTCITGITPAANTSASVNTLSANTTYYFEFIGTTNLSPSTTVYGGVQSFTTSAAPTVGVYDTTTAATLITVNSAQINGTQTGLPSGLIDVSTNSYFIFNIDGSTTSHLDPAHDDTITATISVSKANFSASLTSLNSGTKYYFELVLVDSNGATYFGGIHNFTTLPVVTFDPNSGILASGNTTDTVTATIGANALSSKPTTDPTRSGYTFVGWNTDPAATTALSSYTLTGSVTLYAIWQVVSAAPAPVYVPHPPTITSISAPEVCAVSSQLTIKGTFLTNATVKVDGLSATVLASSHNELTIQLPSAPVGTKTITVTNVDGSATTTVKYAFADTPIYVNYIYPETYKDRAFTYTFKALDAAKYEIAGVMPAGLTLNPLTGELSGTPTQEGDYVFQIIASNICASTPLIVYMFVDKAISSAFTCSVAFNVPSSNTVSDIKIAQLKNCLDKMNTLSPKYIQPVVFLSGGVPAGLTPDQALTHPRYLPIIAAIQSVNANAQIYLGAFSGTLDSVQVNVYWPDPS